MAMSYTTLIADKTVAGSIKSWQNYSKIDSLGVLEEAQAMVYMRLRCREMRASATVPVGAGVDFVALPTGYLDPIFTSDATNDVELDFKDEVQLERMRTWTAAVLDTGEITSFAFFDENFNFDAKSLAAFSIRALFYKTPDPLSPTNDTNWLTKRYPQLLRMACLATGARFAHDDAIFQREQVLLFKEIDEISVTDEMSRSTFVPVEI